MTIRKIMRRSACGHVECVGVHPLLPVAAFNAAHGPCSECFNIHGTRIFWFSLEKAAPAIEPAASRLPKECAK